MSEQSSSSETTTQGGCGCGGHGTATATQERAAAPVVAQPLGEGYVAPEPGTESSTHSADPASIAANVMSVLGDGTVQVAVPAQGDSSATGAPAADATAGVVPGHKPGNLLGLRDLSAAGSGGGCGCGGHGDGHGHGHGHHHEHAHGEQGGGCACGAH